MLGAYVESANIIYLAKEQDATSLLHTLLHELYHVFEMHTERMDSEAQADAFATLLMRIFKPTSVEQLVSKHGK